MILLEDKCCDVVAACFCGPPNYICSSRERYLYRGFPEKCAFFTNLPHKFTLRRLVIAALELQSCKKIQLQLPTITSVQSSDK